ncbi:transposase [Teichococcus oryzae]|uniref:Transposase n=1 Tax=Teichococcus oryzae TaxID=1608942 RepID=A0A5B2T921_9PROT|nr:transposase [Pseudoroseomonas oryzae]KAA2211176.1 transposase [Pseudoroseomonas oryzae]
MRFAGPGLHQAVSDTKTIWLYREQLKQAGAMEGLFSRFDEVLTSKGFLARGGQIIDATLIAAPRQKLTLEEKAIIRDGGTPEAGSAPSGRRRTAMTAGRPSAGAPSLRPEGAPRQAIQIAVPIFGYKSHIASTGGTG